MLGASPPLSGTSVDASLLSQRLAAVLLGPFTITCLIHLGPPARCPFTVSFLVGRGSLLK